MIYFVAALLSADQSFSQSKKLLKKVYADHKNTFYCGCDYTYADKGNMIDRAGCGYQPRVAVTQKGKDNTRARRIEWEHVMPAEKFGSHLPCWKKGGRDYCSKVSPEFRAMEGDMMNLVPAVGELNGDRSNYRYGALEPMPGQYGECRFQVDFDNDRAYVRQEIHGDIARIYFYMSQKYSIPLSQEESHMMAIWDKQDPMDEWEMEKKRRVQRFSGKAVMKKECGQKREI